MFEIGSPKVRSSSFSSDEDDLHENSASSVLAQPLRTDSSPMRDPDDSSSKPPLCSASKQHLSMREEARAFTHRLLLDNGPKMSPIQKRLNNPDKNDGVYGESPKS